MRFSELKSKEVINIRDGCKYGAVNDLEIDIVTGRIISIVVPVSTKLFSIFGGTEEEYIIKWRNIVCIGDDAILVDVCENDYKVEEKNSCCD